MSLAAPVPIREYDAVDRRRFREEIRPLGQPAVLRGLGAGWPAVQAGREGAEATVAYILGCRPARRVNAIVGAPEIAGRFFYNAALDGFNFTRGETALDAFLGRLLRDRATERPYAMAVQSEEIPDLLPGFVEANRIDIVDRAVVPRIWIGNAIRVAPHFDLKENVGMVVAGRRRFTVFPPDQIANLYPGPLELTPAGTPVSMVDIANPDLAAHPRFAEAMAHAQVAELAPGDAIYLPFQWWHAVDSRDPVSILVNYWWSEAAAELGNPYDVLVHALYTLKPLPPEQRAAWRRMLDHYVFAEEPAAHLPASARGVLGDQSPALRARMRATLKGILQRL